MRKAFADVRIDVVALIVCFAGTACSGPGGTATAVTAAKVTPTPTTPPTSPPAAILLTPSSLSFTATGSAATEPFTASESGFSGSFTAMTSPPGSANSCSGIASIAPPSGSGTFTITPQSNGHCAFSVSDGTQSAVETIDVTTTTVAGS